jgi:hypothetical protein
MGSRTLLEQTGQLWKVYIGGAVSIIGWLANRRNSTPDPDKFLWIELGSLFLMFGGAAWIAWSVKCPRCSARWFWLAASRGPASAFISGRVAQTKECAMCGYPNTDSRLDESH